MAGYVEGVDRTQATLCPDRLDNFVDADHPVRVVDAFVEALALRELGFARATAASTGRPGYHPAVLLKLYIYGYLNRIASSRRLEREAARNVELMWLTGRLAPDHKTIADFRRDNGPAIRKVCSRFVRLWKLASLHADMAELKIVDEQLRASPDGQVSLTDPDARSMNARGSGIVGSNVQAAVEARHHPRSRAGWGRRTS